VFVCYNEKTKLDLVNSQWETNRAARKTHRSLLHYNNTLTHPTEQRERENDNTRCCLLFLIYDSPFLKKKEAKRWRRWWWWWWWPICCWHNPKGWRHGDAMFVSLTVAVVTNQYSNPPSLTRGVITSTPQKLFVFWFRLSVSQSVSQSVNQPVIPSTVHSVSQPDNHSAIQSVSQSISHSFIRSVRQ
jgi:hypothetical protein